MIKWFLVSGIVGVVVATILTPLMNHELIPARLAVTLWPSSMIGIVDPYTFTDEMLSLIFTFGGQFLLYGVVGVALRYSIDAVRRSSRSR